MSKLDAEADKITQESEATRDKMASEMVAMQIQFKKSHDEEKRLLEASLRETVATSASFDSHSLDKLKLQMQDLQAASQENAKIIRRLESEINDHVVIHERDVSTLRSTVEILLDNFASLITGRRLTSIRAFDIVANCDASRATDNQQLIDSSSLRPAPSSDFTTFDIVSQPIVHGGDLLLLSWVNLLRTHSGEKNPVCLIGPDLNDASVYVSLLSSFCSVDLSDILNDNDISRRFVRLLSVLCEQLQTSGSTGQRRRLQSLRATAAASEANLG